MSDEPTGPDESGQAPVEAGSSSQKARDGQVRSICRKYMMISLATGVVPAPGLDIAALTAIQVKMLHALARVYGVPFSRELGRSSIASLVGGIGATSLARGTFGSLIKLIPVVGSVAGALTMPVLAAASSYAVARVYILHFESGGTLLDFDPEKMREHYARQLRRGKDVAKEMMTGDDR
jgi:uncharacterized protein (DUF697 family)